LFEGGEVVKRLGYDGDALRTQSEQLELPRGSSQVAAPHEERKVSCQAEADTESDERLGHDGRIKKDKRTSGGNWGRKPGGVFAAF
jgi:hypothetical protein